MFSLEVILLLVITGLLGTVLGWLVGQSGRSSLPPDRHQASASQLAAEPASVSLIVAPAFGGRPPFSGPKRPTDCIDAIIATPHSEESFMITTECIIFAGTREECADFLDQRGIIPFEDVIEPFDARLQFRMDELGVRVFRRNLYNGLEGR